MKIESVKIMNNDFFYKRAHWHFSSNPKIQQG